MLKRHGPGRRQDGFTLIEALVVMVLVGVVGGYVTTSVIGSLQTSAQAQSRIQALADLQRGIERVGRELRVADPLCLVSGSEATELGASVFRDGKRYVYEYYLNGTGADQELLQNITVYDPADAATGTTTSSGIFIAEVGNSLLPSAPDLFEYVDRDGEPTTNYATAAQITINLAKQLRDDDPVLATTTVEVRNTRYSGSVGASC